MQHGGPGVYEGRQPPLEPAGVAAAPSLAQLAGKQRSENFPVALRVLPRSVRDDLRAIYRVVRTIDDVGDEFVGDREAALGALAAALRCAWSGALSGVGVIDDLMPTARRHQLSEDQFQRLIQANLADQHVFSYPSFDDLLGYCALSANPIGRLVLQVFDQDDPRRAVASDHICSALQVLEHCQDVVEDWRRGRVYLPSIELARFGLAGCDLDADRQPAHLAGVLQLLVQRCVDLLDEGRWLIGDLTGWAKIAVAGYAAGGYATATALRRAGWQVYGDPVTPRQRDVITQVVRLLAGSRG